MIELTNRVYVVTGASSGIGKAIAKYLLDAGAKVAMLARSLNKLESTIAEFNTDNAMAISCDVANSEQIKNAYEMTKSNFGAIHGIINNAGLARPGKIESLDETDITLQMNTNFLGTVLCCQHAIPYLKEADNPRIINISSASAHHYDEMSMLSIYASTKVAVERFTRDLRIECQEHNIAVTCIRPGAVMTDFASQWDFDKLTVAVEAWQDLGPFMDSGMEVEHVAKAVHDALTYPAGVAIDLLEVRPNTKTPKIKF